MKQPDQSTNVMQVGLHTYIHAADCTRKGHTYLPYDALVIYVS